jgi:hypothetical protein
MIDVERRIRETIDRSIAVKHCLPKDNLLRGAEAKT